MARRSMIFMPGNNPGMLISSDVLGADSIIFDLEDAVSLQEKDAARLLVCEALQFLDFAHSEVTVRVNPVDSPYWECDLEMIVPAQPDGIVIPKATVASVLLMDAKIREIKERRGLKKDIKLFLLVETALGIMTINDIARASDQTVALLLGAEDLSSDMGIKRTKGAKEIEYARYVLATAARAYQLDGLDTPFTDTEDMDGLRQDTEFARSIGLSGKLAINPRQIEIIHDVFSPTQQEIEEARKILFAAEEAEKKGLGVFSYRGKMVDLPVIKRARSTMESARKWGLVK